MLSNNSMMSSIYIPIIGTNISQEYIANVFQEKNIGLVSRVDFVLNKIKNRREAFVHFSEWYNTNEANQLKYNLEKTSNEKCRFIYSGNNYWPILLNKNPVEKNNPNRKSNSVYEIEDRINSLEKNIKDLSFMTKLHDANIRYILHKSNSDTIINQNVPNIKRFKSDNGISLKRPLTVVE